MATNILRPRNLAILAALVLLTALLAWGLQPGASSSESKAAKTPPPRGSARGPGQSLINIPFKGDRASSITAAEKQGGFPLKVPARLFGKDAQVFINEMPLENGQRTVNIVYSDKAEPTNSEGYISIWWRNPNLASPQQIVEEQQKEGVPIIAFREHKGHPGFTLEKSFNPLGPEGREPSSAKVIWVDGENMYTLSGPIGMGLDELISIADSID